ncbi:MAG: hypothetical protein UW70_C0068G0005 [Candidatus Peregrinibacteria bacterium GW2011_GWA2_44_7]|nr:MAG: hypothetical protein UW70_C0068G0005 [Candidatus Peregrinibacteria bacterium GW2011_GWA2_44_7]
MRFLLLRAKTMQSFEGVSDTDTMRSDKSFAAPQCGVKIVIVTIFFQRFLRPNFVVFQAQKPYNQA